MPTTKSQKLSAPGSQAPKYQELAALIREQIVAGNLQPGDRLPSLTAMRDEYNASRPTVEKAYALLADQALIDRPHGLSAVVAAPKPKQAAGVIGLCGAGFLTGRSSFYWTQLLTGIHSKALSLGVQVLLLDEKLRAGWEKVDGILMSGWSEEEFMSHIPDQMPFVSLLVPMPTKASIQADEYSGMRQATQHLLSLGHRKIAFLHGPGPDANERIRGYEAALRTARVRPRKEWKRQLTRIWDSGPYNMHVGGSDMTAWLQDAGPTGWKNLGCTALLCQNDETALGAIAALRETGLFVPRDVSVIGFDGTDVCEVFSPSLTTVALPLREIGANAVEMLLRQIENDEVTTEHRTLSVQLQVRESTAPPTVL